MIEVIVERDSVCMGDDCFAPHARTYTLKDDATYKDLFKCLKKDKYFPSISGNNVVWVMTNTDFWCIFSYFTKTDKFSMGLMLYDLKTICQKSNKLTLKYYTSPKEWKEKIYRMYNNDEFALGRDGWCEEAKYCDYLMEL